MSASRSVLGAAIGDDGEAVGGHHRLAAGGGVPPAIKLLARDQIRRAQAARPPRRRTSARSPAPAGSPRSAAFRRGRNGSRFESAWRHGAKCQTSGAKCQSQLARRRKDRAHALFARKPPRQRGHRQPQLEADLARARAEAALRCGDRRRRRAWPRHRALSRQGARHRQCRRGREVLYRLGQCRAQHHHRPLQLSLARQSSLLRMVDEAVGGARAGPQLQRHGQPARRAERVPFRPAARRLCAARQRHAAARRRCRAARPRAGARAGAVRRFRQCALSHSRRAVAAARRHGAA